MYEKRIIKPIFKNCKKFKKGRLGRQGIRKSNRGGEYNKSTLYAICKYHIEPPHFTQLIFTNKINFKRSIRTSESI
jgi:hypothetical protein